MLLFCLSNTNWGFQSLLPTIEKIWKGTSHDGNITFESNAVVCKKKMKLLEYCSERNLNDVSKNEFKLHTAKFFEYSPIVKNFIYYLNGTKVANSQFP